MYMYRLSFILANTTAKVVSGNENGTVAGSFGDIKRRLIRSTIPGKVVKSVTVPSVNYR